MFSFQPEVFDFLSKNVTGRIATATCDGIPHIAAVSYVNDDKQVYLCTMKKSKKARNLRENSGVAFIVDDSLGESGWRYVILEGSAEPVTDAHEFGIIRNLLYRKYPSWESAFGIY